MENNQPQNPEQFKDYLSQLRCRPEYRGKESVQDVVDLYLTLVDTQDFTVSQLVADFKIELSEALCDL